MYQYEQAVTWCLQVWANSYEGESPSKIINKMTEANIESEEKLINELLGLLVVAHNNTRMKENRGYKPSEIERKKPIDKVPTIVPASSNAATILKDVAPQLQAMGVPVDLNGNTDVIHTTMFPRGLNEEPIRIERKYIQMIRVHVPQERNIKNVVERIIDAKKSFGQLRE